MRWHPMIEFAGVTKRFGATEVLRGVDLQIDARPRDGARRSERRRARRRSSRCCLASRIRRPATFASNGASVSDDDSYRAGIGYMPQIARFPDNLTPSELFAMLRDLRGADARRSTTS